MCILHELPSAHFIATTPVDRLQNLMSTHFDAAKLKLLAQDSIGIHSDGITIQIKLLFQQLKLLMQQKRTIESQLEELLNHIDSPLLSIPGISTVLASIIIGEIGSSDLFDSPDKLLAFAGLDPTVYQSGSYEAASNRMSKRGSKYLRYALIQAARLVARYDTCFNSYYTKKRLEGKHHFVALSHCAHKLVRVIFKLLREDIPFAPQI